MRYFVIVLLLIGTIIVAGISTPTIGAVPPLDSQFIYDASEVILVGRVTSVNSTFSSTHNLYQIEVEKYLKNQLDTDTVLAAGQNTVIAKLGNQVFTSGDRVLFFLNNDTIGYDKYTGVFGVSYESKIIEPQWDHCKIFEKSIPAAHWVFGGIGPMPKISQQNNTDTENFLVGKKVLITYDIFNHTPDEKNIDVGIQIKNLDDPNSLYVYTEISQHLLKACTTYETMSWDFTPTKLGRYSIEFYDLKGSQMTIGFTAREQDISKHLDRLSYPVPWERKSPLKQFEAGIPIDKIQCKEGLELILKSLDNSPACVKPETKQILIERGWAKLIEYEIRNNYDGIKNHPTVKAFYAKYPNTIEEVRSDHISYVAGSDDGFKVRMKLYFDENYELDHIDFHCYFQREHQNDVPESFILRYLKDFECEKRPELAVVIIPYGSANPESQPHLIPEEITVVLGKNSTVHWTNNDDVPSALVSDSLGWSTGMIKPGESAYVIFNETGVYPYHGEPHPWKVGKVIVLAE